MSDNSGISGQSSSFIGSSGGGAPIQGNGRKPGDVVFSTEALKVLDKMEAQRVERNKKRTARREAEEDDVSADEDDDLAPYVMVVPSGEGSQLKQGPIVPSKSTANPSQDSKLLFDDAVAEKNVLRAHDNTIPTAIYSLAKNGISPLLTLFLLASLARIRSSNVKTVKHGTGESTKVTVIDLTDFPDEESMDQAVWFTCYNTFLSFLETAAGARIYQSFATHYNQILTDPKLSVWFPAYREFDRGVRAQFFTSPYIIDIRDDEYRSALQSAKNSFLMSNRSSSASVSKGGFPGTSGPSKDRNERPKPYDKDINSRKKAILCFRCGRSGHGAITCEETNPSRHGRQFVIYANRDGLFRILDKRAVCMGFNCAKRVHLSEHRRHD
ncbi:hypothetical protein DFH09DRAFT_1082825 [Mycena vulgaris]|nr:hypothetical protein DFH09DRAFT_1082825 [Mycena vulgaris]